MTTPAPWKATLHLDVRSRGARPGTSHIERRVYTADVDASPDWPDDASLNMVRLGETFGGVYQAITTWTPAESDPQARTALFRQSLRRSDRLVDELERYGWQRRPDLEARLQELDEACAGALKVFSNKMLGKGTSDTDPNWADRLIKASAAAREGGGS